MNTLPTSYGPRLAFALMPHAIPADPAAALAKAALLDLHATLHQNDGDHRQADRLSHLALELRCQALGVRA